MRNRIIVLMSVVFALLCLQMSAQDWEKRSVTGVDYKFPVPYKSIQTGDVNELYFDTTNVYISVTAMFDSTEVPPSTQLQRSRYYAATAATAAIRLRGKMTDNRDTMIGESHAYYTAIEVLMYDSATALYQLLQFMPNDTLYAFSSQYVKGDELGEKLSGKFFNSLKFEGARKGGMPGWLIILVVVPVLLASIALLRSRLKTVTPAKA